MNLEELQKSNEELKGKIEGTITSIGRNFASPADRRYLDELVRGIDSKLKSQLMYSNMQNSTMPLSSYTLGEIESRVYTKIIDHAQRFTEKGSVAYFISGNWYSPQELLSLVGALQRNQHLSIEARRLLSPIARDISAERTIPAKKCVTIEQYLEYARTQGDKNQSK